MRFQQGGKFLSNVASAWKVGTSGITDDSYSIIDTWVHLTSTFNLGGTNHIDSYINGDEVTVSMIEIIADVIWDNPVTDDIGRARFEGGTGYADAVIDELRWSKIIRSDEWIKTSFNTMNDPSSFLSIGPEESGP